MAYVIFGDAFTFPDGTAATNRVYTYAKGFKENGIKVHVICFRNDYLSDYNGISDGIHFYHPFGQTRRSRYFIIRRWQKFVKYLRTFALLKRINKSERIIAIHVYSINLITELFAFFIARTAGIKLLVERSEHPLRSYRQNAFIRMIGNMKVAVEIRLYDGIFCISNYLIDFFRSKGVNNRRLFLVPSTVERERFENCSEVPLPYKYILYCGGLTIPKDGVNILIESFGKIADKHPEIKLVLIGEADSLKEEMTLRELAADLALADRVIFLGVLSRYDIPAYECNAEILALARPKSIIADAGFPSKLTEYLAAGKPVVTTMVGEIPSYLEDNVSAFLSEPGSADAFADKLDFVLSNYEIAEKVAERGRELTSTTFNYRYQATRMISFIESLQVKPEE
jgi:glycosyltransferase involved in cell wall biosynthesis